MCSPLFVTTSLDYPHFVICIDDKHILSKYHLLLANPIFNDFVIENDQTGGHAPMAEPIDPFPALSRECIISLYEELHEILSTQQTEMSPLMKALVQQWNKDQFLVIMDEWEHGIVYIGNNVSMFVDWMNSTN